MQFKHYNGMLNRIKNSKSLKEVVGIVFCGPAWVPGKPRLGILEEIPEVRK